MGIWESNRWVWQLNWTAELTVMETAIAQELHVLLQHFRPRMDSTDRRRWIPGTAGLFSIKSAFTHLQNRFVLDDIYTSTMKALQKLWLNNVPSKSIFKWMGTNSIPFEGVQQHFSWFGELAS
ncbi:hypothetical protein A2U01_0012557, partial [Trifolium medium]|nr:hypothetical protein [Trifolium medium]